MAGKPVGTIFAELALDSTKLEQGLKKTNEALTSGTIKVEDAYKSLGIKSDAVYEAMRRNATAAVDFIKNKTISSTEEIARAQEAAANRIKQINEQQYGHQNTLLDKLKANWVAVSAAVAATVLALMEVADVVKDATLTAARFETMGIVMRVVGRNAGYSGAEMEAFAKSLEKTGISMLSARQSLTMMARAQLDLNQATVLGRIAQDSAVIGNMNSSQAFEQMIYGIQTANVRVLRTIGINVQFKESYAQVAKELGRTVSSLSEAEKAAIRMNEVIESGKNIAGTYEAAMETAGKQLLSFERHLENLKVLIGLAFTPVLAEVVEQVTGAVVGVNKELSGDSKDAIHEWGVNFRLTLMSVEAEIMRLSMFIDKVGGTLTAIKAGAASLLPPSMRDATTKEAVAQNDALRSRYAATEKQLEALAAKYVDLEYSITAEGKAAAKAAQATADAVKSAAVKSGEGADELTDEVMKLIEQWQEQERTLKAKIAGEGLDAFQKKVIDIRREAEKLTEQFKSVPGAVATIAEWKVSAERGVEIEQEEAIAKAVQKIRDDLAKRQMDALKFERSEADRLFKEREKAEGEYKKIVTDAQDWSVSEHQRAINKILSGESTTIAKIYEMWEAGSITLSELDAGIAAVREAARIAREAQAMKELSSQESFYSTIAGMEQEWYARKVELINKEKDIRIAAGWDVAAANQAADQAIGKARVELFDKEHAGINAILSATKASAQTAVGLFREGSKERKIAHDLEMAATIAELAIQAQKNLMIAVGAVAQQGSGDPYTAFARIAAMISVMTSVLAMAGLAFGGGAGGGGGASAPVLPPSTVLGAEAGTGSESIGRVWDLLQDTYDLEYRELTGIHDSMKDLNRNITGLVSGILRTGSVEGMTTGVTLQNTATAFGTYGVSPGMEKEYEGIAGMVEDLGNWFLNTVVGGIFGGGVEESLQDSGIEYRGASVGDLIAGRYMGAVSYALIKRVEDGGWFGSDDTSYYKLYRQLSGDTQRLFALVFKNMGEGLLEIGKAFGADLNEILEYTFEGVDISFAGKTGEEINKLLSEHFSKVGDEAVMALFGNIVSKYQQLNEGLLETAVRLVVDMGVVNETLRMTGLGFIGTIDKALELSESLVYLAGGLDKLQEAAGTYYDKFFSDAEKQARLQAQLTGALGDMGMTLPTARDGYRDLVEGLDLSTVAGQEAYVMLLKLSEAADRYYSALEDVGGSQEDLTKALRSQSEMIKNWVADLSRSSLAPMTSLKIWQDQYASQKAAAFASDATTQDVSSFLNYAKDYLAFQMRFTGGTNYQAAYDAVVADVQTLGGMKDTALTQLDAIVAADQAARDAAEEQNALLGLIVQGVTGSTSLYDRVITDEELAGRGGGRFIPTYSVGGLTSGPSIAGELGPSKREWVVPTYEPHRSRFLRDVGADPEEIGRSVARHIGSAVTSGGGERVINVNLFIDGKQITNTVVRSIRGGDPELIKQLRRAVN